MIVLMVEIVNELVLYLRLAQAFKQKRRMPDRDRALVLAGTCAAILEMKSVDDFCRKIILQNNHGHMMKRWGSFAEAIRMEDFGIFIKQLQRRFPIERAENFLMQLKYQCDVVRDDYESDEAFAAAVMGVDYDWLTENFG
ncbi:hypothetical protein OAG68_00790 [bacterium]|nr:hypothetical protein [bacterium]